MTNEVDKSSFTLKEDKKQLVTGPVAIPNCPDCDFAAGEKVLTPDEIEGMAHEYNVKSRMADQMHVYGRTGETIGETVENWTLKEAETVTNINGDTVVLPRGTWMATVKVTDPTTWSNIESGKYRGFSAMYVSRSDAETIMASKRTLIADLEDPVPLTISIVDSPCVYDAIFTSIKQETAAAKAGRKISNATLNKINKIVETMKSGFDEVQSLISVAEAERTPRSDVDKFLEDNNMDEKELMEIVGKTIDERLVAFKEELTPTEPAVEPEVEPEPEVDPEPTEAEKQLAEAFKRIGELEEKLGNPTPQSLKGLDEDPNPAPVVVKGVFEDRDVFGRKIQK